MQTQQTGGVFLKVADVPSALASLPQLVAQSLDSRLFAEALVNLLYLLLLFFAFAHLALDLSQRSFVR